MFQSPSIVMEKTMYKNPENVVKAIDFITYGCSGWACVAAYMEHYSTVIAISIGIISLIISLIYKHMNYLLEKKKYEKMFGENN